MKTMVLPATVFAVSSTLLGPLLTTNASPDGYVILWRLPLVVLSAWMELLVFDISNQRQAGSAIEDAVNKPWRPIPSGRISEAEARHLLMAAIPATVIKSVLLGSTLETLVFFILTWIVSPSFYPLPLPSSTETGPPPQSTRANHLPLTHPPPSPQYNDLAASESHYLLRTLVNTLGISCYCASAAAIAVTVAVRRIECTAAFSWAGVVGDLSIADRSVFGIDGLPCKRRLCVGVRRKTTRTIRSRYKVICRSQQIGPCTCHEHHVGTKRYITCCCLLRGARPPQFSIPNKDKIVFPALQLRVQFLRGDYLTCSVLVLPRGRSWYAQSASPSVSPGLLSSCVTSLMIVACDTRSSCLR